MNGKFLAYGLIAAALMNISGVLIFTRAFTNTAINNADPVVMSNFGLLMIVVWGLAYLSVVPLVRGATVLSPDRRDLSLTSISTNYRWIFAAFAIEKLVYVVVWIAWHLDNSVVSLYAKDVFAGVFFSIYGLNDFIFMLFFAGAFFWPPKD